MPLFTSLLFILNIRLVEMEDNNRAVIIDSGTRTMKVGLAGDDAPRLSFFTVAGYPKTYQIEEADEWFVGKEAKSRKSFLSLRYPIERGIIKDWEIMGKIWDAVYANILLVDSAEHPLVMTYNPLDSKENMKRMMEIIFEKYRVPSLCMAIPAVLSLIACGRRTGLIVECGEGCTYTVPIYEGYIISPGMKRVPLAGMDVTRHLMSLLSEKDFGVKLSDVYDVCTNIKENLCYVSSNYQAELCNQPGNLKTTYQCPDGRNISIDKERFISSECLFKPDIINAGTSGIQDAVYDSIRKSDIDLRRALYGNIIMSGGTSLLPGILKRMKKEIETLSPPTIEVNVSSPMDCAVAAWIGGSVLASLDTFPQMCTNRRDYEDSGSSVIHKRWL